MQPDNHAAHSGYKHGFVRPNPARDLAAYDQLPRPIRRALDDAPAAICAVATLEHYRKNGAMSTIKEIRETVDGFYAAYEIETGVPRPKKPLIVNPRRRKCRI